MNDIIISHLAQGSLTSANKQRGNGEWRVEKEREKNQEIRLRKPLFIWHICGSQFLNTLGVLRANDK